MSFKLDVSGIVKGLDKTVMKTQAALNLYCDTACKKLEAEAKNNAPWEDRTGDARKRMTSDYRPVGMNRTRIELSHGVDYGYYLEFCHEQQNEIVGITVSENTPSIIRGMNNLLGK